MDARLRTLRPTPFALGLAAVVLVAAIARLWGVGFGLPFLYHPDEAEIVTRGLAAAGGQLNPHWFNYPSLYIYAQAAAYACLSLVERLAGHASSYGDFVSAATVDPTAVYTLGRSVTALLGAATVVVVGLAGRSLSSLGERGARMAGLAAAALLAVDLLHVEHSHFITTDVPMTFAAACLLAQIGRIATAERGGSVRAYAVAGALVGLAASLKYPGAFFAVAVVAVYVQQVWGRRPAELLRDRRLPAAAVASIAAFVAGTPFSVLAPREFARDLAVEMRHASAGHLGFETVDNGWLAHLGTLVDGGDVALLALFLLGAVMLVRRRDGFGRSLVVTALVLFGAAGASRVLFARYLLPLLPVLVLVAAYGLTAALDGHATRLRTALWVLALVAACAMPAFGAYHRLRLFTAPDTRTLARAWIEQHVPEGALVAVERNSIPTLPRPLERGRVEALVYDLATLRQGGVRYVVVAERMYKRFLRAPERYGAEAAFYRDLLAGAELVGVFSPYGDDRGRLTLDAAGGAGVVGGGEGPEWRKLPDAERSGYIIEVFELSE